MEATGAANISTIHKRPVYDVTISVWFAVSDRKIMGPSFLEQATLALVVVTLFGQLIEDGEMQESPFSLQKLEDSF
jgi:hypothetical protein